MDCNQQSAAFVYSVYKIKERKKNKIKKNQNNHFYHHVYDVVTQKQICDIVVFRHIVVSLLLLFF